MTMGVTGYLRSRIRFALKRERVVYLEDRKGVRCLTMSESLALANSVSEMLQRESNTNLIDTTALRRLLSVTTPTFEPPEEDAAAVKLIADTLDSVLRTVPERLLYAAISLLAGRLSTEIELDSQGHECLQDELIETIANVEKLTYHDIMANEFMYPESSYHQGRADLARDVYRLIEGVPTT